MTISTSYSPSSYNGNGVTLIFSTVFPFISRSDVVIYLTDTSGADHLLVLDSDYTITGGSGSAGTVTMSVAPATGETLTITRVTGQTQEVDYVENDPFPANSHEEALDKLTLIAQENAEKITRSLLFPVTAGLSDIELPTPSADDVIGWDSTGTTLENKILTATDNIVLPASGIVVSQGTATTLGRTITGTTNEITVTNGTGVSGNPTLALSPTVDLTGHTVKLKDSTLTIEDNTDSTKKVVFEVSGITTGTTRTLTAPDASGTIALASNTAPIGASYLTLGTDATLTSERVLTAGTGITLTDAGAGSTLTVSPSAGAVLQVVSTSKTDAASSSSTIYTDISGMAVSITPSSASNKVLVIADLSMATDAANFAGIKLVRGSTDVSIGDAAGSRFQTSRESFVSTGSNSQSMSLIFLDSPATTSSTTYKIQWICNTAGSNYLNRSRTDTNSGTFSRSASSITVMEIKG